LIPSRSGSAAPGTSLVEVVIAMGLIGAMLVSVAGLLAAGNRQVAGGARASRALALARSILEDLDRRGFDRVHGGLGCDGARAVCLVASGSPAVEIWRARADDDLPGLRIEVRVEAVGTSSLRTAASLRVEVWLGWREGLRPRQIRLSTLRV